MNIDAVCTGRSKYTMYRLIQLALQQLAFMFIAVIAYHCNILLRVESRRRHHGDLRPASLPADRRVRSDSDPSPAHRCRQSAHRAPTAEVDVLRAANTGLLARCSDRRALSQTDLV